MTKTAVICSPSRRGLYIYLREKNGNKETITCEEKVHTISVWQQSWERESRGKKTAHLIKDVES